jgi:hypothetical protein
LENHSTVNIIKGEKKEFGIVDNIDLLSKSDAD